MTVMKKARWVVGICGVASGYWIMTQMEELPEQVVISEHEQSEMNVYEERMVPPSPYEKISIDRLTRRS